MNAKLEWFLIWLVITTACFLSGLVGAYTARREANQTIARLTAERDSLKVAKIKIVHDTVFTENPNFWVYKNGYENMVIQCSIAQAGWERCLNRLSDGKWPSDTLLHKPLKRDGK